MTTSAREKTRNELLTSGLADWVHLGEIHYAVTQDNPDLTVEQVQQETLDTIRTLLSEGLFEVGDLSGPGGTFAAWKGPLEDSINRIAAAYIDEFADENKWLWVLWLGITERGQQLATAQDSNPDQQAGTGSDRPCRFTQDNPDAHTQRSRGGRTDRS